MIPQSCAFVKLIFDIFAFYPIFTLFSSFSFHFFATLGKSRGVQAPARWIGGNCPFSVRDQAIANYRKGAKSPTSKMGVIGAHTKIGQDRLILTIQKTTSSRRTRVVRAQASANYRKGDSRHHAKMFRDLAIANYGGQSQEPGRRGFKPRLRCVFAHGKIGQDRPHQNRSRAPDLDKQRTG